MYPDWTRLMDFAKKMEARQPGSKSGGPALCQESWTDCGCLGTGRDKSFSNGGCFPLPSISLDVAWREVDPSKHST